MHCLLGSASCVAITNVAGAVRETQNFGRGRGQRRAPRAERGGDLRHELTVPFATAVLGGQAAITVRRQDGNIETIKVKIPAGIDDGKKIRLRGQGEPGVGDAPA